MTTSPRNLMLVRAFEDAAPRSCRPRDVKRAKLDESMRHCLHQNESPSQHLLDPGFFNSRSSRWVSGKAEHKVTIDALSGDDLRNIFALVPALDSVGNSS